jgi:hypothetical protein
MRVSERGKHGSKSVGPDVNIENNIDIEEKEIRTEQNDCAHDFSIQHMLPYHHRIHAVRVVERQERKAPRAPRGVTHDGAGVNLAELFEVGAETLCVRKAEAGVGIVSMSLR